MRLGLLILVPTHLTSVRIGCIVKGKAQKVNFSGNFLGEKNEKETEKHEKQK